MHTIDEQKEAIIHEIQHAIQGIENFANGSNLEYWKNLGYSDEEAMAMYYNTAGEREARDVSARRDYNAEQRKTSVRTLTGKMLYLLIAVMQGIRRIKILLNMITLKLLMIKKSRCIISVDGHMDCLTGRHEVA